MRTNHRHVAAVALLAVVSLTGCGSTVALSTREAVYGGSNPTGSGEPDGLGDPTGVAPTSPAGSAGVPSTTTAPPVGAGPAQPAGAGSSSLPTSIASSAANPSGGGKTASAAPTHAVHLPTTGRGWDAHNVYIGVMTVNDFGTAATALGAKAANPGNQQKDALAMAALMNKQGGIFGRKVVVAFDNVSTASLLVNAASDASQACVHFTQDRPVIAVYNDISPIDLPAFRSCFAQAKMPLFEASIQSTSRSALNLTNGYVTSLVSPTYTDMAPTFVDRLQAEHYFTGWNVTNGTAGSAPVKVAIIAENVPADQQAAQVLSAALARDGHPPVAQFNYTVGASGTTSNLSSAVLQFRSRGVTHVIGADAGTGAFMVQAQSQHYYPRYGVNTIDLPASSLTPDAPKKQLQGALGIGWYPTLDVGFAQDPGYLSPADKACVAALKKSQSYTNLRFAFALGVAFCDGFGLIRAAVVAAGGLTGPDLVRGEAMAGPTYVPSGAFSSNLHAGDWAIPASGRDLGWVVRCACFHYLSKTDYAFAR
ncbi:MAG TPA: hypothetical protein VHV76_01065 [Mycobacteriales bacterium]|jgi:hypothetical protein|nr:hypothetical protein [Mycobacteriales bacterium]